MISYCGRVAILGYIETQLVHINLSNKQTKQNSERKEERKKEKETETGWAKRDIQKYGALK